MSDHAKRRIQVAKLKDALRAINELAAGLPSRDDLARASASLVELAAFVQSVSQRLAQIPTSDEAGSVLKAIDAIQNLLERAEASPALSLALGIEAPRRAPRRRQESAAAIVSVDEVSQRFGDLSIDQLREKLADERHVSIAELQSIAKALGARAGSRLGRDPLVANIVTKVANLRGYRSLGPASQPPADKKGSA